MCSAVSRTCGAVPLVVIRGRLWWGGRCVLGGRGVASHNGAALFVLWTGTICTM